MKQDHPNTGIGALCKLFGKTRHAYYDHLWRQENSMVMEDIILQEVKSIRKKLPRLGVRKLFHMLEPILASHNIQIGRDYLFDMMADHGMLIRHRKRCVVTTNSRHWMKKYINLIHEMDITRPEAVWVSDITYIRHANQWGYLSLVTDAYSRKIMGYAFRKDLSAEGCISALEMALSNRLGNAPLIHHSDRGSQYCSQLYVSLLIENNIRISMTEKSDPYENAIAERVNGILKSEFNLYNLTTGFEQSSLTLDKCIHLYNAVRPHASCNYLTPDEAHTSKVSLKKRWKKYPYKNKLKQPCIVESGLINNFV